MPKETIRVTVTRHEELSPEVVAKVACDMLEYLDQKGFAIEAPVSSVRTEWDYASLGEDFAEYLVKDRGRTIV